MKKLTRSNVLPLSVLALIVAVAALGCGEAVKPTPTPTPKYAVAAPAKPIPPPPFSDVVLVFERKGNSQLELGSGEIEATFLTRDGSEHKAWMGYALESGRSANNYERTNKRTLSIWLMSVDERQDESFKPFKPVQVGSDMTLVFSLDLERSKTFDVVKATNGTFWATVDQNWPFPLLEYLFQLDEDSYRKELPLLASQAVKFALHNPDRTN